LVLVEKQTCSQMAQTFVCEPRRGQELDALYLAKVRPLAKGEQVQQLGNIVAPGVLSQYWSVCGFGISRAHRTLWSPLSSRKLARIDALSFWMTALSSAMVLAARTLRMNCLTVGTFGSAFEVMERLHGQGGGALTRTHLGGSRRPAEGQMCSMTRSEGWRGGRWSYICPFGTGSGASFRQLRCLFLGKL
jgi:hypothetical protein